MKLNQYLVRFLGAITLIIAVSFSADARELPGKTLRTSPSALNKMMECLPPVSYTEFSLNNVRFGLEAGGQLWELNGQPSYEIPKVDPASGEPSIHSLYAGALWIGGFSPDGQLKLAAVTYRTGGGTDFYNGPLSTNGLASADYCNVGNYNFFDNHFFANRTDVSIHRAYHQSIIDGTTTALFPDGYSMPEYFNDWPGDGPGANYAAFLAPYEDWDGNGSYEPALGDYPLYDLDNAIDCRTRQRTDPIPLFGDETMWWVFNDNGGIHTETGGEQIGMEIQAQAFAYTTTDEINNMSFYNYTIINRGVQTLNDCYFGQWVDPDLGCATDDYVGCDVQRGLSYTINGTDNDQPCGGTGYELNPPAVGVDFFEGPFQDEDGINNPLTTDLQLVNDQDGIPYAGIGIGYEDLSLPEGDPKRDNVIDNERFGMRRFVYYNRSDQTTTPAINGEPNIATEFYSYLDGEWLNGQPMTFGGNGVGGATPTDYMFPGLSDPEGFATNGATTDEWTEAGEGNQAGDRRFIQSAGTFVLDPGEFNNVTVGVVWARPFADVGTTLNALRIADDKAQSLFDNCFRILSGPDAPDMTAQELENEVILYIENNNPSSNNFAESYGYPSDFAFDPLIPSVTSGGDLIPDEGHYYEFQGYKIYQLKDATVSSSELNDVNRARLVVQTDKQDNIADLINYVDDPTLGFKVAEPAVIGAANDGIKHSFQITSDLFATDGAGLVNFKKYYFMAVAYAHNEYEPFNPGVGSEAGVGQALTYLESRKSATGGIQVVTVIPHDPTLEGQGTVINSSFGDIVPVTRLEGEGNGGNIIDITEETTLRILESPFNTVKELDYEQGSSPLEIKVYDPLNVKSGDYLVGFNVINPEDELDDVTDDWELSDPDKIGWYFIDLEYPNDTIFSENAIDLGGEQLMQNAGRGIEYGFSIAIKQYDYDPNLGTSTVIPALLEATVTFDDPTKPWLTGVPDSDMQTEQNWIRSGTNLPVDGVTGDEENPADAPYYFDKLDVDPSEIYESVLGGTISPWVLGAQSWNGPAWYEEDFQVPSTARITDVNNVDIKFTSDKSKWSRVPVLEMQHFSNLAAGGAEKLHPRRALSVDKNGKNQLNGGNYDECTSNGKQIFTEASLDALGLSSGEVDEYLMAAWPGEDPDLREESDLIGLSFGMGWFPGYAIDIESGERMNMAFGEDSSLPEENGADMIWNPTSRVWNDFNGGMFNPGNARFGGKHYFYVFRNQAREIFGNPVIRMPLYDNSDFMFNKLELSATERKRIFRACTWVGLPLLNEDFEMSSVEDGLIPNDLLIRLRIAKPYERLATIEDFYGDYLVNDEIDNNFPYFYWDEESGILDPTDFDAGEGDMITTATTPAVDYSVNNWMPYYSFNTEAFAAETNVTSVLEASLDVNQIQVVPNPYYGITDYEVTRIDTRVKITNLPADRRAIVRIYNTGGVLVRTLDKDSPDTFVDWDLKNERNVPIAGGVHIFHIEIPGVGEKVVKWFGVMRPIDLDQF